MTRAVLDTNTWVSGLGWGGPPGNVVEAALAGRFEIVTSPALLDELRRVLAYPKLAEMFGDVDEVVELIALASHIVRPGTTGSPPRLRGRHRPPTTEPAVRPERAVVLVAGRLDTASERPQSLNSEQLSVEYRAAARPSGTCLYRAI